MGTTRTRLATIDIKGGLWGPDLLAALADDPNKLPSGTVTAESYDLPKRASTEQAARAAWTVLTAAWEEFSEHHQKRIAVFGTPQYGADNFTWDKWTRHLLDQLGYDPQPVPTGGLRVDNADPDDPRDSYPITHTHHDQIPLHAVPAGVELDRRAAGVHGAARQSPHSLLQDYLNRTDRHLWGIVTNGLTLRLLRNNAALSRQAYIEFDLAGIFDEGAYADFALLWHAAHATRLTHDPDQPPTACIAEGWQEHATKTGVAALEDLRDGVEAAIAEIGQGLIEHPDNRNLRDALADPDDPFDATSFYRELLYIAYRHVFWFALDDRDLLHPDGADRHTVALYRDYYASTVLRTKARAHLGGRHPDGWQHFHTVAGWFATPDGCPPLAVPGLLGRLWDPDVTPHLNGTTLTNRRYYEAIRRLGYVQRDGVLHRINYDAMGSEELGAVYESLLEIRPVANPNDRTFTPDRTHGSDRKKTGSYYTPTSLIKILLDEALDPVLDDRTKQAIHDLLPNATPEQERDAQEQALLGTTICDPAMGSAHFLVAAGMRVAKRLAAVRTGDIEPAPDAVQQAFRDVASRCLYGVDVNPMAVELAKLAIWLECHVPGQPLTFLDHHLKHGNALLGVGFDPDLIAWHRAASDVVEQGGVPDHGASNAQGRERSERDALKALAGDDRKAAASLKNANRKSRAGQQTLLDPAGWQDDHVGTLAVAMRHLTELDDTTPAGLATKEQAWAAHSQSEELRRERLRADAWMACWTMPKTLAQLERGDQPFDVYYDCHYGDIPADTRLGVIQARHEAKRLAFFHWYLEFPDIAQADGFDLMLGNPPWERVEVKQQEWFAAAGYPGIVEARTAAVRKRMVAALADSDDQLDRDTFAAWQQALRDASATSLFLRESGRYPFGGTGNVDTYAVFADHYAASSRNRLGIITPSAILTGFIYRDFFASLVDQRRLAAAYDFENKGKRFFPEVHASFRFVTLIATAPDQAPEARFAFMVHDPGELDRSDRSYTLTPEQIALVNPNTKTAPVFLTPRDAEITTNIYERHPVLIHHGREDGNPWGITFQRMFEVHDSGLFHTAEQLRTDGWTLTGNTFERDGECMLPLYEAKFFTHFDHREKDYSKTDPDKLFVARAYAYEFDHHEDPSAEIWPRYWVLARDVAQQLDGYEHDVLLAWSDVTAATNHRTCVASLIPRYAANHKALLAFPAQGLQASVILALVWSSFAFDWIARKKISGTQLSYFIMEQLPVPRPSGWEAPAPWAPMETLHGWLGARSAALSASTHVMARALGYPEPVPWEEKRRELWRTELDAAMFQVYGYSRDEVEYVMDTFPIVARKDRQAEGLAADDPNWRAKRLILEKYDELGRHAEQGTTYLSPDPPPPLPDALSHQ